MRKSTPQSRTPSTTGAEPRAKPWGGYPFTKPRRDVLARLRAYQPHGERKERPEILGLPGMQSWTRELARVADLPAFIAGGHCLIDGSPLILTLPGAAAVQHARRVFTEKRAADQVEWIDQWSYGLSAERRLRLRVTAAERQAVDAVSSALGLSVAVAGTLATIAILMQAPLVPLDLAEQWRDELAKFARALRTRAEQAAERVQMVEQRPPAERNVLTFEDVLAAAKT
jgi:hypothetical protein